MKRTYESPVVEALKIKSEDIITLSYMLDEMPIDTDTNNDTRAKYFFSSFLKERSKELLYYATLDVWRSREDFFVFLRKKNKIY